MRCLPSVILECFGYVWCNIWIHGWSDVAVDANPFNIIQWTFRSPVLAAPGCHHPAATNWCFSIEVMPGLIWSLISLCVVGFPFDNGNGLGVLSRKVCKKQGYPVPQQWPGNFLWLLYTPENLQVCFWNAARDAGATKNRKCATSFRATVRKVACMEFMSSEVQKSVACCYLNMLQLALECLRCIVL